MTGPISSPGPEDEQVVFRRYVAIRLEELMFAFSDHELFAECIDGSGPESTEFHGYVSMELTALVRALEAAQGSTRPSQASRACADPPDQGPEPVSKR